MHTQTWQFLGLAEAVGAAIASECEKYEGGGATVLCVLLIAYGLMFWVLMQASFLACGGLAAEFQSVVHVSATGERQYVSSMAPTLAQFLCG